MDRLVPIAKLTCIPSPVKTLILLAVLGLEPACNSEPDPKTVEGALAWASQQIEARNTEQLFRVIDERTRHAMASIVQDRHAAAEVIRRDYPAEERTSALAALGDAAEVENEAELFARRCRDDCLRELAEEIGSPVRIETRGREVIVDTARDTTIGLYRGSSGWYGITWRLQAHDAERNTANRDLQSVESNAAVYRQRRELN